MQVRPCFVSGHWVDLDDRDRMRTRLAMSPDMDAIITMLPGVFWFLKIRAQCFAGMNVPITLSSINI